jgi:hypothetical protein
MKIELTKSQISYLKSLDSKKNKRKFLLDCLVENVCVEETQSIKANYSPEEIELVKHNINQREVSEQGSELLKFDMLEDYPGKRQQKLFNYLSQECNFTALKSQMDDIESIVLDMTKSNENAN